MGTDTGPAGRFQGVRRLRTDGARVDGEGRPDAEAGDQSATRDAARCHKVEADLGTLEAKKWADFVVLNADPLVNVSNTRQIADVAIAGNRVAR